MKAGDRSGRARALLGLMVVCVLTVVGAAPAAAENEPPVAVLQAPSTVYEHDPITFDARESYDQDGTIVDYQWDLYGSGTYEYDTGSTSTLTTSYPEGNQSYRPSVRVTDDGGAQMQASVNLIVRPKPPIVRIIGPDTGLVGVPLTFEFELLQGSWFLISWGFDGRDEGNNPRRPSITHAFTTPGAHTVSIRVQGLASSGRGVDTKVVTIAGQPPVARVSAPTTTTRGSAVTFDAGASSDADGTISDYVWDLDGNGSFETDTGTTPTATQAFTTLGDHSVQVRVTDDTSESAVASATVAVLNLPPTAAFSFTPASPRTIDTVQLSAAASSDPDGTVVRYEWDLDGNGSFETDTGATPTASRRYTRPGTYSVSLRVTDSDGATATIAQAVVVACTVQVPILGICLV